MARGKTQPLPPKGTRHDEAALSRRQLTDCLNGIRNETVAVLLLLERVPLDDGEADALLEELLEGEECLYTAANRLRRLAGEPYPVQPLPSGTGEGE
jgi:hypothetical protein